MKTGVGNPVGRGGWIAVIVGFAPPPSPALPATIGPWKVKPKTIPGGYRLVKTGPKNPVGRGGWLAVVNTASPYAADPGVGRRTAPGADRLAGAVPRSRGELAPGHPDRRRRSDPRAPTVGAAAASSMSFATRRGAARRWYR